MKVKTHVKYEASSRPTPLIIALILLTAYPGDLDATPELDELITRRNVTLRTEIERGLSAAPNPVWIPIRNYSEAVQDITKLNITQNTESAGFEFGLHYAAWHRLWACLRDSFYRSDQQRQQAITEANYFYVLADIQQRNLRLSDEDVAQLAGSMYVTNERTDFLAAIKSGQFRNPKSRQPAAATKGLPDFDTHYVTPVVALPLDDKP